MFALVCKPMHTYMLHMKIKSQDGAWVTPVNSFLVLRARKKRPGNDIACALRCQTSGLAITASGNAMLKPVIQSTILITLCATIEALMYSIIALTTSYDKTKVLDFLP